MLKTERTAVMNLENAIRGARNPLNSWARMDSAYDENGNYILGPNDLDLAKRLARAGSDHRKYLRQIFVSVDITAPLYWWKEFDTYKVGTVANSTSTMHKIHAKPFDRDDEDHRGGGTTRRMQSTTDPESGQQSRDGKPDGFHYSEHRTVDSKRNVIVNVHIEPANINDVTPIPEILDEIQARLGKLPKYMGLDAGYHNAWIAHLLEKKGIQGVIGYRRHTHKTPTYGKYRFKYDPYFDAYICPEQKHLYWKTTTREGYRQYFCDSKTCKACPRRTECFGASMTRRMVERHVWQDALDDVIAFTKSEIGRRIYNWRKETIERSFAEAKVNHGLRYARMLGIQNMREQSFLTAAVQNIKRLVASSFSLLLMFKARFNKEKRALSVV